MEISKLEATPRQSAGTRAARRLRREGKLPGIVYGHQREAQNVAVNARDLGRLLEHGAHLVELQMTGEAQPALIKDVQFAHLGTEPVHVDFVRVSRDERVTVKVPLEFRGTPVGVVEGGLFDQELVDLEIECLAIDIPDSIRVNVGALKIGESLHVKDLELPASVTAETAADAIVCAVRVKKDEAEVTTTAEGETVAEPEIITRKKEDEAAEGEKK